MTEAKTSTRPRPIHAKTSAMKNATGIAGVALALLLSGCGLFGEARAVTYEVEAVSGDGDAQNVRVEYLGRESGISRQETTGSTVAIGTSPAQFETLAQVDDEASISVDGLGDLLLRCVVRIDGSETLAEAESSAPGENVECAATVPAPED